mmetsp:Transcript_47776/g.159263  ORF Transcript_47776/g.159263 Transcript_47776/m.159263 type:complete len:392 (+) Transcript_47776:524-1699(+)
MPASRSDSSSCRTVLTLPGCCSARRAQTLRTFATLDSSFLTERAISGPMASPSRRREAKAESSGSSCTSASPPSPQVATHAAKPTMISWKRVRVETRSTMRPSAGTSPSPSTQCCRKSWYWCTRGNHARAAATSRAANAAQSDTTSSRSQPDGADSLRGERRGRSESWSSVQASSQGQNPATASSAVAGGAATRSRAACRGGRPPPPPPPPCLLARAPSETAAAQERTASVESSLANGEAASRSSSSNGEGGGSRDSKRARSRWELAASFATENQCPSLSSLMCGTVRVTPLASETSTQNSLDVDPMSVSHTRLTWAASGAPEMHTASTSMDSLPPPPRVPAARTAGSGVCDLTAGAADGAAGGDVSGEAVSASCRLERAAVEGGRDGVRG